MAEKSQAPLASKAERSLRGKFKKGKEVDGKGQSDRTKLNVGCL